VQLDCETTTLDEVTLVTVQLHNDTPVARRVQLQNRLDGPVMPPRTDGVPEAGWDDDGYQTVVPAESTVAVGYACPAPECDPPVVVTADERASDDDEARRSSALSSSPPPEAVVRRLGRATPPRDAVPTSHTGSRCTTPVSSVDPAGQPTPSDTSEDDPDESAVASGSPADTAVPEAVVDWFTTVETRIDRADRLTDPSVSTATTVLAEVGGLAAVDGLQQTVDADADRLRAVAERAETLADHAEATDVSLSALRRLA
jgi:hypothetical protein